MLITKRTVRGSWWRSAAALPQLTVVRAATHRSKPLPTLRSTKHDKVFTYGIGATRGTRFAHLGTAAGGGGGWRRRRFGPSLASMSASSGAPLGNMKTLKGAAVFGDPSGTVDSSWAVA
jgi:hypothetical protein